MKSFKLEKSTPENTNASVKGILVFLILLGFGWFFWFLFGGKLENIVKEQNKADLNQYYVEYAQEQADKLEMMARNKATTSDLCVQSMITAEAYLNIKDERNYSKYKEYRDSFCN